MSPLVECCPVCGYVKQVGVLCDVCRERARLVEYNKDKAEREAAWNRHKGAEHAKHQKQEDR